jgi:four helix bundle protein
MEKPARSFEDLVVWQKAHHLVLAVYRLTKDFPADERFGLTSQIRRAAVSVAANIAEGFSKRGKSDKARFFNIAQGSLEEVHYYLILGNDLGFGDSNKLADLYSEVARLLNAYCRALLTPNS